MSDVRAYIAESYLPRIRRGDLADATRRAQRAAEELAAEGQAVRHLHTTFVPEDEVCLHVFEATSAQAVGEVMRKAALAADRIVEAVE
jgi:uncharacterized protein DUF4242